MEILGVLKPDAALRRAAGARILRGLLEANLGMFLSFQQIELPLDLLERHYYHVRGRDFYPWMVGLLTGSPAYVALIEGSVAALDRLRRILGYTRAHQAHPKSLRYRFCPYGGMNGFHLSEDEKAAQTETSLWKNEIGIAAGQFTMPIEAYIEQYANGPDNTSALRQVCTEIKAAGQPAQADDIVRLRELMAEECIDATPAQVNSLAHMLAQGCFLGEVKNPPSWNTADEL